MKPQMKLQKRGIDKDIPDPVIGEVYDLLNPSSEVIQYGDEFILHIPVVYGPLREIRFRSFKPIVSRDIANAERLTSAVHIYPVINAITDDMTVSTAYQPDFNIFNERNGIRLPIRDHQYTIEFNGDITELIKDVNDATAGYCEDFDWDGTFVFANGDGTDRYELVLEDVVRGEYTSYSANYDSHALPRGPSAGAKGVWAKDGKVYYGPPSSPSLASPEGVVAGSLLFTDGLTSIDNPHFNYLTDTSAYYWGNDGQAKYVDGNVTAYGSRQDGEGVAVIDGKLHLLKQRTHSAIDTVANPVAVMWMGDRYLAITSDDKVYESSDGSTWTELSSGDHSGYSHFVHGIPATLDGSNVYCFYGGITQAGTKRGFVTVTTPQLQPITTVDISNESHVRSLIVIDPDELLATTDTEIIKIRAINGQLRPSVIGLTTKGSLTTAAIYTSGGYIPFTHGKRATSIDAYYNTFWDTTNVLTPTSTFTRMNDDFTLSNLSFELRKLSDGVATGKGFVMTFIVEVIVNPLDIINTSAFSQTFNAMDHLSTSPFIARNDCITLSKNFDKNIIRAKYVYGGVTLTLASSMSMNQSHKLFTDYTEATVYFKHITANPSMNTVTVYMLDKHNKRIGLDYLNAIYDQIIVEVDYVYGDM